MVNDPKTPAIPSGFANTINNLMDELSLLDRSSRKVKETQTGLNKAMQALEKSEAKSKKVTLDLSKAIAVLGKDSAVAKKAVGSLADDFAASMDAMSESQKQAFDKLMQDVAAAEGGTNARSMGRDQLVLANKKQQMEVANYRDSLNMEVMRGKAITGQGSGLVRVGNMLQGSMQGVWAKAKLAKSGIVEGVGKSLGLSSGVMKALTGPVVILTSVFMALNSIMKAGAENAGAAAKAGFNLGDSQRAATTAGAAYNQALIHNADYTGMSMKEMKDLGVVLNQEMGQSIDNTMDGSVKLAKGLGYMGLAFGVSSAEAVKLGIKMGVLARADGKDTLRLFENLGERSSALNVGMEELVEPMNLLAEATGAAGGGALESAQAFNTIFDVTNKMSSITGPFNKMFSSMKNADKVGAIKSFATNFTKIGDLQMAAFSSRKGEKFWDTVGRVSSATSSDKMGYIGELSKKLRIGGMKNDIQKDFTMGMVASKGAFGDDWKSARQFGRQLNMLGPGASEQQTQDLLASQLDQRLQNKQSIGQWQAGGGDMLTYIARTLDMMLETVKTISTTLLRFSPFGGATAARPESGGGNSSSAAKSGRQTGPMRSAARVSA